MARREDAKAAAGANERLRNERQEIDRLQRDLLDAARRRGYDQRDCFALRLAVEEAIRNAFRHGCCDRSDKTIDVWWRVEPSCVEVVVDDPGPGFDPQAVPDPRRDENLENPSGRGLLLMRAYMTRIEFNEQGNRVTMIYAKDADDS